jgi:DNA-binding LytR/AlgR family response regulator
MINQITYIIADDDSIYRELTLQQLQLIPNLVCLAECDNAVEVAKQLVTYSPDLLILDVEMPELTGIQLVRSLKQLPLIIFISSYTHYAADAFDVDAIDFLSKPATPERLIRAVEKARNLIELKNNTALNEGFKPAADESFFIKDKNAFVRIKYTDVLYIQSLGDFVNILLANGDKKIALVSMKNIEQQLPAAHFIRISRSHMVNIHKITAIESTTITLDKIQLQIGKTYTDIVIQTVVGNAAVKRFI